MSMDCGQVTAYLNQVLAFRFCDEWLELRCCESIDKTGFGNDEEEDLGAGEDR